VILQTPELAFMQCGDRGVEPHEHTLSSWGEIGRHEPPILDATLSADEFHGFEAVEKPGDIGHPRNEAVAYVISAQPCQAGTTQDSHHVVLSAADSVLAEQRINLILQS
jgi:hypothetical protein